MSFEMRTNKETFSPTSENSARRALDSLARLGFLDILLNRGTGIMGLVGVLVAVWLPPKGLTLTTCTAIATMGVPCPGCGLTRSVTSFFHGEFLAAWQYNPFGFGFAVMFALLAPLALAPARWVAALRTRLEPYSYAIGIAFIVFMVAFMLHGGARALLVAIQSPMYAWWWDGSAVPPAFQHLLEGD